MKKTSKLIFAAISLVAALSFMGCPKDVPVEATTLESVVNSSTTGTVDLSTVTDIDSFTGTVSKAVTITGGSSVYDMKNATLTIKAAGVTLKNLKNLDVVVDAAVGDGDFNLVGCTVNNLTVNGGGSNSIHVDGCTVITVSITKDDVRVVLENEASVTTVNVNSNALLEATDAIAKFGTVTITGKNAVTIAAKVATLDAGSGTVTLTSKEGIPATVTTLKATKDAKVSVISSTVTVTTVTVTKVNDSDTTLKIDIATTADATEATLPDTVNTKVITVTDYDLPTKTSYKVGGSIVTTGFSATVVETTNGTPTTKTLTASDVTFSGFDSSKAGYCTVKITYSGIEVGTYTCTIQGDTANKRTPTTDIKSEADLINCFIDSYKEYAAYFYEQSSNRAAATTSADATTQINDFIKAIMDNKANFLAIPTLQFKDINFDEEIDLENIDVDEALATFKSAATSYYNTNCKEEGASDIVEADILKTLFGETNATMCEKYATALKNSDCNINKLYLRPVLTINTKASGSDTYISTSDSVEVTLSADANKLIQNITGVVINKAVGDIAYLPLSTFSVGEKASVSASITADNFAKLIDEKNPLVTTTTTKPSSDKYYYASRKTYYIVNYKLLEECLPDYKAAAEAYVKGLVCTSTGLGGNIKVDVNINVKKGDITKICEDIIKINKLEKVDAETMFGLYDNYCSITISSANTSGTTTWSNTYTCTGLYNMVKSSILPSLVAETEGEVVAETESN